MGLLTGTYFFHGFHGHSDKSKKIMFAKCLNMSKFGFFISIVENAVFEWHEIVPISAMYMATRMKELSLLSL